MPEDDALAINPTLLVRLQLQASVPGRGTRAALLAAEHDPELCQALLAIAGPQGEVRLDFSPRVLSALRELGALGPAEELPQEVFYESVLTRLPADGKPTSRAPALRESCVIGSLQNAPVAAEELVPVAPSSAGEPVLWVDDPRTGLWFPYFIDRAVAAQLLAVAAGELALSALEPALHAQLGAAGALSENPAEAVGLSAHAAFAASRVVALERIVPRVQRELLRRYARALHAQGLFSRDQQQVDGREFIHNEPLMRFFNQQLAQLVGKVVGEEVKPSYVYLARYGGGSELRRHIDRPQCRWNMSLVIDQTSPGKTPWPLCVEVDGRVHELALRPGDAGLFLGSEHPHWRPPLARDASATVCFFHFVPASFEGALD